MTNEWRDPSTPDPLRAALLVWAKVDRRGPGECWPWLGYINPKGYGRVTVSQVAYQAHRVAFELTRGPIPDGLVIDHLCRTRHCCNPAHLEPVTNRENVLRGVGLSAVAARKTHCPAGHPYSGSNLRRGDGGKDRKCRACDTEGARRRYHQRKAAAA